MQSQGVQRVSYYKTVTRFINDLKADPEYTAIAVTGHSLGGGIAIISAAQVGVGGVAISGPNAMLSRLSVLPQVSVEQLNTRTLNVIPNRDIIPRFDDPAQNYQMINCRSESRNPISCHSIVRTICELLYTCGTGNRPALCECVTSFNFPRPQTVGDQNFEEECASASTFS
jgi:lipase ATG15